MKAKSMGRLTEVVPVGEPTESGGASRGRTLRWVYHHRGLLAAPPVVFAMFCFACEIEHDWLIWPLGTAIVALGVALRVWAQAHIRFRLSGHRHLATTGPYAIVRNPLYIANTLICVGAVITSELLWLVPIAVLWCMGVYSLVVRQEEPRLLHKYGEVYSQYLAAAPRWVPRQLRPHGLGGARGHLLGALLVEVPCLLILVPFLIKEVVPSWFGQ